MVRQRGTSATHDKHLHHEHLIRIGGVFVALLDIRFAAQIRQRHFGKVPSAIDFHILVVIVGASEELPAVHGIVQVVFERPMRYGRVFARNLNPW